MNDGCVPNGAVCANFNAEIICQVNDATILHIGSFANLNCFDVGTQCRAVEDT